MLLTCILCLFITGKTLSQPSERYEFQEIHMGTKFRLVLYADHDSLAERAAERAFNKIEQLDNILSDYKPQSELNRLSRKSGDPEWVSISPPLFEVLAKANEVARKTNGAFDITIGPYVQHWRTLTRSYNPDLPTEDTLQALSQSVGYENIQLDSSRQAVQLSRPSMRLDPGGIAKGYAADQALKVLESSGIPSSLIDAGGDITAGAPPPSQKSWKITVHQYNRQGDVEPVTLFIANQAVATSGDLFNHVIIEDQRYSHIINPHTGMGLTNQIRVTIIAPDGVTADSYASAVSVFGPDRGIKLLKNSAQMEGVIESRHNGTFRQTMTAGFSNYQSP